MAKQSNYLLFVAALFLFVQCKREPLQVNPKVSPLSDFESCDGEIALNIKGGKSPYQVNWSNSLTDTLIQNLAAGTYIVTVTDARKKVLVDTITVTQPQWPICIDVDGNNYKTAIFGDQTWMIENLRVTQTEEKDMIESFLYEDKDSNALVYGRLYKWKTIMMDSLAEGSQGICPDGWHIPTDEDWSILIDNISSFDNEIPNLEKTLDLTYTGFYNDKFYNIGSSVSYWTSTQASDNVWKRYFNKNLSKAFRYHENKNSAIAVRCIKD